jgi:hypothetical protein
MGVAQLSVSELLIELAAAASGTWPAAAVSKHLQVRCGNR